VFIAEPVLAFVKRFLSAVVPTWAQVTAVETFVRLRWIEKIKRCAWADVIDGPFAFAPAIIRPRHSWLPLAFELGFEF
jgi:hypothetical protein